MNTAVIVLEVLGTFIFLGGLIFACLPSAMVRQVVARFRKKRG